MSTQYECDDIDFEGKTVENRAKILEKYGYRFAGGEDGYRSKLKTFEQILLEHEGIQLSRKTTSLYYNVDDELRLLREEIRSLDDELHNKF